MTPFLILLALVVFGQSMGVPLGAATALTAAGVLAASGRTSIVAVCAIALVATTSGACAGFAVGRRFGTSLFTRPGPAAKQREHLYRVGRSYVLRVGWIAVLVGRFVPALKETAAVLSGAFEMRWSSFLFANAVGAVTWTFWHALLGYYTGSSLGTSRGFLALVGLQAGLAGLGLVAAAVRRNLRRRTGRGRT